MTSPSEPTESPTPLANELHMRLCVCADPLTVAIEAYKTLERENIELRRWRLAVIDALTVSFIYRSAHDYDPRMALAELISFEQLVALDPAVSKEAAELRDTYLERAERAEAALRERNEDAARLREIEHRVWHLLDDSEEDAQTGRISFDGRGNEDHMKLCELLPEEHPRSQS